MRLVSLGPHAGLWDGERRALDQPSRDGTEMRRESSVKGTQVVIKIGSQRWSANTQ